MIIKDDHTNVALNIRIQDFKGLPRNSPSTSPYFDLPPYKTHTYSIGFSFTPTEDINGDDLVFGNDFDHPIRYRLPPGFGTAMRIVQWAVDPGLENDVYADEPWLYGRFLSSIDTLHLGSPESKDDTADSESKTFDKDIGIVVEEGGTGDLRTEKGIPDTAAARKKHFLYEPKRKEFTFEKGKEIRANFGNGYLDFTEFALRLPGFHLPIINYWDGQPLRYVLKNRVTGTVYMVVCFTLYLKEDVNEDGSLKEGVEMYKGKPPGGYRNKANEEEVDDDEDDEEEEDEEHKPAQTQAEKKKAPEASTSADDVD